jgi:preprotein translocase subunit SecG
MLEILLYIVFFASALFLIFVILLQEGKGGGLSDAFGGAGADTFGVRAGGINRFTFGLFFVFMVSALSLHLTGDTEAGSVMKEDPASVLPGLIAPEIPAENP